MGLPDPTGLPWPHLMMCYRVFLNQLEEAGRTGQTARAASLRTHVALAEAELSRRGLLHLYTDICEREAQRLELKAAEAGCTTPVPEGIEA
jgi:hypothetical protein